jgi:hypothetical protein
MLIWSRILSALFPRRTASPLHHVTWDGRLIVDVNRLWRSLRKR